MKMMSLIIHPQVVLDLYEFLFRLLNTKEDILKNAGNKRLLVLIYFHSMKNTLAVNEDYKLMQVWNNLRLSK